jgi:hypothetical protein
MGREIGALSWRFAMGRSVLRWILVGCVAACGALGTRDAAACGGGMEAVFVPSAERIAEAERLVENGRYFTATILVHHEFPAMRDWGHDWTLGGLEARAARIMAVSVMRMNGALTLGTPWRGWNAKLQNEQLEWSVAMLQQLDRKDADTAGDPRIESYLGEAMSKLPARRADALALLESLAAKDLIVTPQALVVLTELRATRPANASS